MFWSQAVYGRKMLTLDRRQVILDPAAVVIPGLTASATGDPFQLQPVGGAFFAWDKRVMEHPIMLGPQPTQRPLKLLRLSKMLRTTDQETPEFVAQLSDNGCLTNPLVCGVVARAVARWKASSSMLKLTLFATLLKREAANRERANRLLPASAIRVTTEPPPGVDGNRSPYVSANYWFLPKREPDSIAQLVEFVLPVVPQIQFGPKGRRRWKSATTTDDDGKTRPFKFQPREVVTLVGFKIPPNATSVSRDEDDNYRLCAPLPQEGKLRLFIPSTERVLAIVEAAPEGVDREDTEDEILTFQVPLFQQARPDDFKNGRPAVVSIRGCGWQPATGEAVGETHLAVNVSLLCAGRPFLR